MTTESKHTPLPWKACETEYEFTIQHGTKLVGLFVPKSQEYADNAKFICEAVNNYDALRQENERLRESLKEVRDGYLADPGSDFDWDSWYRKAEEALDKGEGNK